MSFFVANTPFICAPCTPNTFPSFASILTNCTSQIPPTTTHCTPRALVVRNVTSGNGIRNNFGTPEATFSTIGHDQHKTRRAALNRVFSIANVRRLQPAIDERVQRLIGRFRVFKDTGEVIKADYTFAAFTNGKPGFYVLVTGIIGNLGTSDTKYSGRCSHGICIWPLGSSA